MTVFSVMAKAPAKKVLSKIRKDLKLKTKTKRTGKVTVKRRDATIVLAQGAVAAPRKNFGTNGGGGGSLRANIRALDARVPRTLGLPRAVGPYSVIRTTKLHSTNAQFVMFCPVANTDHGQQHNAFYDWCGFEDVNAQLPITATDNARAINMPLTGLGSCADLVPAALTVQVMNPASLQTASGVFAMTRVNQQLELGGSPSGVTWDEICDRVISFYSPRLLTGGKLSLRGVKCDAYPLNMSDYSNFRPLIQRSSGVFTWDAHVAPAALSPIVFIQQNETPVEMEFMITIEWRVRFDPGNPATASHTHHDTMSDAAWNDVVKAMSCVGHGVEELSEDVAAGGALAAGFAAML